MISTVVQRLQCPVCQGALHGSGAPIEPERDAVPHAVPPAVPHAVLHSAPGCTLRCDRGHSFDQARQGYVHLAAKALAFTGDSADMVAARSEFFAQGHYDFIARALAEDPPDLPAGALIVDAGGGIGATLARVLVAHPGAVGLCLDASKFACRRAARAHARMLAAVADTTADWPVASGCCAWVLNVFAPRNPAEFARVLVPGGHVSVVVPTQRHLGELVDRLRLLRVDPLKRERVDEQMLPAFRLLHERIVGQPLRLSRADVQRAVQMGPNAHHRDPESLRAELETWPDEPDEVETLAEVQIRTYVRV